MLKSTSGTCDTKAITFNSGDRLYFHAVRLVRAEPQAMVRAILFVYSNFKNYFHFKFKF